MAMFESNLTNSSENFTDFLDDLEFVKFSNDLKLVVTILWPIIVVIGVLANGCVLMVIMCTSKTKTTTQYFLLSLSTSDLIFLLICPTNALIGYNFEKFNFISDFQGLFLCKFSYALAHV